MSSAAICDVWGTEDTYRSHDSFDSFQAALQRTGRKMERSRTTCPLCARGDQEILEGATIISFGIHELRHEPSIWGGIFWLWQKGGAYGDQFALPEDLSFRSPGEARAFTRQEALTRIRSAEWP